GGWLLGAAVLVLASLPVVVNPYYVIVTGYALVLAIACLGLNLLLGHAGLLSLGHAAYFGLGAYTGAFMFTFGNVTSFEVYLASGVGCAALAAAAVGAVCVRTTRMHFTILTLAFTQTLQALLVGGAAFRPFGEVGKGFFLIGHGGLYLPRFTLAGVELEPERFVTVFHYVSLAAFVGCTLLLWRVVHSPFGMALRATRDNDTRARFIGIPVARYRWAAFVMAAAVMALAGGLFGQLMRQITPQQVGWFFNAELVVATLVGGTRLFSGPIVGAFVLVALQETALRVSLSHQFVLGVLLVAVVCVCPGGLAELGARAWTRLRRRAVTDEVTDFAGGGERPWTRS
ncbi:MAG TPA: branched-chain amino acid ABC transporter permease, partial [Candidatus Polarisedimenticolia bacterium]|nr:branched-chain amino acid ABC transporter permease [Candidatus Polarisedimenticolia bacterium]